MSHFSLFYHQSFLPAWFHGFQQTPPHLFFPDSGWEAEGEKERHHGTTIPLRKVPLHNANVVIWGLNSGVQAFGELSPSPQFWFWTQKFTRKWVSTLRTSFCIVKITKTARSMYYFSKINQYPPDYKYEKTTESFE